MTTSFKLLGAALVLASSTLMGFYLSYRLKRRLKLLNALCELMSSLCTGVRYSRENVITLVRRSSPRLILDVLPDENNPRTFLQKTVESLQSSFYLTDNDESLLTDFFSKLGSTDTDGQLEHINIYKISFKTACDNSLEDNNDRLHTAAFDPLGLSVKAELPSRGGHKLRSGREEQAMLTTLAGLIVVMSLLMTEISSLFTTIKGLFGL